MDDLTIALIGALIGGGVTGIITYYFSIRLLIRQLQAQTYSDMTLALNRFFITATTGNPSAESIEESERLLNEAYGRLLIFGDDTDMLEFHKIYDTKDIGEKVRRSRKFIIRLRKKTQGRTAINPDDIARVVVVPSK